jgi:hypothetical protein
MINTLNLDLGSTALFFYSPLLLSSEKSLCIETWLYLIEEDTYRPNISKSFTFILQYFGVLLFVFTESYSAFSNKCLYSAEGNTND